MGPPGPLCVRLPDDPENPGLNCCGNTVHVPLEIKFESHARTGYPHSRHEHAPIRTPLSAALTVPLQLHVLLVRTSHLQQFQVQARTSKVVLAHTVDLIDMETSVFFPIFCREYGVLTLTFYCYFK